MDDSWVRFWERLIVDWVVVAVGAFLLQGLWFGISSYLATMRPDLEPTLVTTSARLGIVWLLAIGVGLLWGLWRAMKARR